MDHRTERTVVPAPDPAPPDPSLPPAPSPQSGGTAVVIAIGNEYRRDDGAGPAVLRQLRDLVADMLTWSRPSR